MSTIGIIQLHEDITRSKGNYCAICFRSSTERRLVEPVFLNIYLSNTNGRKHFKKSLKACYVCEALATSAVRFQKAVDLASRVGVLYNDITTAGHWQGVAKYLNEKDTSSKNIPFAGSLLQRAIAVDRLLRSTPRFELYTTDTLVVSSIKDKPFPSPAKQKPSPPLRPPPPLSDTVVIVDDDEPPVPPHVGVVNQETNEIVLHPVLKGSDGKLYVPSLHLQVQDGALIQGIPDFHMQNNVPTALTTPQTNTNNNVHVQNVTNYSQNQTYFHQAKTNTKKQSKKTSEKSDYYNFLQTQNNHKRSVENGVNNVEVIQVNDMSIVLTDNKKRKIPEDPLHIDSQDLNDQMEHQGSEMQYQIIDDDPGSGIMRESRAPVPRTDQTVDWEDKIPMDVISFMDATDPNPSERIMQPPAQPPPPPLAVIADVRSLPHVPASHVPTSHVSTSHVPTSHVPTSHVPTSHVSTSHVPARRVPAAPRTYASQHIECIDLC